MAGLLDALFDASTYGNQGGGLLARLQPLLGQFPQSQGLGDQPSPLDNAQWPYGPNGAPQAASFADRFNALPQQSPQPGFADRFNALPNADAPAMATPMNIGGYQMPRLGSEAQYAAIPQAAQPAQGQMLPQQAPMQQTAAMPQMAQQQAPQSLPPALGGVGSILGRIGNPEGLIARLTGNDSRSIARQNLKAQYDALVPIVGPQKAMLAVMNPEAGKTILAQALEKKNYGFIQLQDGTVARTDPQGGGAEVVLGKPGAKFSDVTEVRKEVGGLPEVKRYAEAVPIFRSMVKSRDVDTAAADLDFVYGVAKIFDPESVVREGEMKLVGKAQSLPEDIKGLMGQVAIAKGRLTPEGRQRILEVAQTRMSELRDAHETRVKPYGDIATRFNMRPEDVLPSVPEMPTLGALPQQAAPKIQEGATATNPKTGQTITFRNGKWQ